MVERFTGMIATLGLLAVAGCAETPQYAVRPGAPRATMEAPKPAYPVRPEPTAAPPKATDPDEPPAPFKPVPIDTHAAEPAPLPLRPRQSSGPALATPRETVVQPGESLFEVAERVRTPVRAIIDANGLKSPYEVTPGQTLKVPPPVVYVVKAGDTWTSVGRRFAIEPRSLANLNDLAIDTPLKAGQRLALPSLVKDLDAGPKPVIAAAKPPIVAPMKPLKPVAVAAPAAAVEPKAEPKAEPKFEAKPAAEPATASLDTAKGVFVWPLKGEILSTFGPKGPGQRNDGINIAAKLGDPVRAAAAGTVVYAGNSVPGFGNLVVIKHADGWTSLYGNLGKMSVKIRASVAQGDVLGLAGQTGAVDRPQVHFEVRHASSPQEKARPVDPVGVLP